MSRRVLLHVGCPKTGTSYLQDVLFRNQPRAARARHPLPRRPVRRPLPRRARPDDAAVGRPRDRGRRRLGPARRRGARLARHRDHQPRDLRARHADPGRAGARLPRRRRGPPRAVGARPGPPDPRGVAGERQAPQPHHLREVPADHPRPGPRLADRLVVLGGAGDPRHPRPVGLLAAARARAPGHACRRPAPTAASCGAGSPAPSASTACRSTSPPSARTRPSACPRPRSCARSTSG